MIIDPKKLELPKPLLAKEWSKNKGVIAKMAGETGIGAALDEVAEALGAVLAPLKIANFPADEAVTPGLTFEKWAHNAAEKGKDFLIRVTRLSDAVGDVEAKAKKTAEKFAKSKVISKDSTQYTESVEEAAKAYKKIVDGITSNTVTAIPAGEGKRIKAEIAEMNKLVFKGQWTAAKLAVGKIHSAKAATFLSDSRDDKASDKWNDLIFQPARTLMAGMHKLGAQDPAITKVAEDYNHKLHGADDKMNWTNVAGNDKAIQTVFDRVTEFAQECKKLADTFS